MRKRIKYKRAVKRFYRKIQRHSVFLSLVSLTVSLCLFAIAQIGSQNAIRLAESWRDAISRSWGDEGAKPFRADDKWAVNFNREPTVTLTVSASLHVEVIRANSTESEHVNATSP